MGGTLSWEGANRQGKVGRQGGTGIRHIPLHGLRRTHISQLVSEGLPIAMVAARAGHCSPNVTLGTYSHYMPGQQAGAVQSVARFSRKRAR